MQEASFYFLPGQEAHGRLVVARDDGRSRLGWQVVAPRDWAAMAQGRPAEELPRLLARFSPSHHLAAAQALDQLFGVKPPAMAVNFRELIRQLDFYRHHLRRFYFLLTLLEQTRFRPRRRGPAPAEQAWRQQIQQHLALAREALAIAGGRPEQPLTAVVGGVSRFLKPEHYQRLQQISGRLATFTQTLAEFLEQQVLPDPALPAVELPACATLTLADSGTQLRRQGPDGREQTFPLEEVWHLLGQQQEPWTYEPLVYWQAEGWPGLTGESTQGLLLVGPLARRHQRPTPESRPAGEADPEPQPRFDLPAAFDALLVELLAAAASLLELTREEKLTGPELRAVPAGWGPAGQAAVDGPRGPIIVACRVDDRGLLQELRLLDPEMFNNAFVNLLLYRLAAAVPAAGPVTAALRTRIAMGLLPW